MSMNFMNKFFANFREFYNEINAATLTGAIDVIVVEQPDGTFTCSPFHVRFGKLGVLRSREKIVDIEINGVQQDIHMKLGDSGEAFFVEELSDSEEVPEPWGTSPIPLSELEELYTAATSDKPRRKSVDLSFSLDESIEKKYDNQVNDYKVRRNTGGNEKDIATQKREFLEKHVNLGNIAKSVSCMEEINQTVSNFGNDDNSISSVNNTSKISDEFKMDDEDIFAMDSLDDHSEKSKYLDKSSGSPYKVFIAEKIKENELSSLNNNNNNFTPIKNELSKSVEDINKVAEDATNSLAKCSIENDNESKSSKKRKRKKSLMKKRNSQRKTNNYDETNIVKDSGDSAEEEQPARLSREIHFFSDTEVTTSNSGNPNRQESQLQSDSEFEFSQRAKENIEDDGQSWTWGQLPTTKVDSTDNKDEKIAERNSVLSGMFSFMKHTNRLRQNDDKNATSSQGVYLTDLNNLDPEVSALYLMSKSNYKHSDPDNDCESGNGPSLPQSPNSIDGAKSIDSDYDETSKDTHKHLQDISLSLCGWNQAPNVDSFLRNLVTFSDLCNNPLLLESNELVIRINGKYYNWKMAMPIIISYLVYQRPLPHTTLEQLCEIHNVPKALNDQIVASKPSTGQETAVENAGRYSWWSWRRSKSVNSSNNEIQRQPLVIEENKQAVIDETLNSSTNVINIETVTKDNLDSIDPTDVSTRSNDSDETTLNRDRSKNESEKYRKTLRLTSDQIKSLNLRDDVNEIEFSVTTAYQGTTRCKCYLYKWRYDDKIVISDIDGTITKSDVLGHILPIVGKDWAQTGVAQLFTKIKENGYKLLYLSARAIGQSRVTREYLRSIKQGDLSLPDGPILLNPTSLMSAFHREVIEKKPEQFKIQCLSDIKALFTPDSNPFYAGYGNRINDVWAYRAVGIPIVRIFTINHKGELKHELTQTFQSSYNNMSSIVDQLFPPLREPANEYSEFMYWREPIPAIPEENLKTIEK